LDLQFCLTAKTDPCVIPTSVTLNMTSPIPVTLSGSDQIVIQGSGNSVIDLKGSSTYTAPWFCFVSPHSHCLANPVPALAYLWS
jgi:hypothetical protein